MSKPLHVLVIEDSEDDTLLLMRELRQGGYEPTFERVDAVAGLQAALNQSQPWDVIISDYKMPTLTGLAALEMVKQCQLDVPFIIVSGTIGEETAVEAMKAGAHDYLMKDNLTRLVPAVERELRQAESRRKRQQTETALRESKEQYRSLTDEVLDSLAAGVLIMDANFNVVWVNQTLERYFGMQRDEMVGQSYRQLILNCIKYIFDNPEAYVKKVFAACNDNTYEERFECHVLPAAGRKERWLEHRSQPIRSGLYVGGRIEHYYGLTERKQAEQRLDAHARQQAALFLLSADLVTTLDETEICCKVVYNLHKILGYDHVSIFMVDDATGDRVWTACARQSHRQSGLRLKPGTGLTELPLLDGRPHYTPDVSQNSRYVPGEGVLAGAEVDMPLKIDGKILGVLAVEREQVNGFDEDDFTVLTAAANQTAVALQRAKEHQAVKQAEIRYERRSRDLALLNRIIAASVASLELEVILQTVCSELAQAFNLPQAAVSLINEDKTEIIVVADYHLEGRPPAPKYPISITHVPATQYILTHKKPLVISDIRTNPIIAPAREVMLLRDNISILVVPLIVGDEVVGILGLESIELRQFSSEEINLAQSVADQVSGAIVRARLDEEHHRLSTAVEQTAESVIITDTGGVILYVNSAFERVTGYSRAEAVGRNANILKSSQQDVAFYREFWATIKAGQVWHGRMVNKKKDGTLYSEDITVTPIRNTNDEIINYVAVQRDVTHELELEEQLRRSQRMEAVGQLTAGIAHDFNNLLTAINGFAELIQYQTAHDGIVYDMAGKILHSGQHAADLVSQLLAFSRKQMIRPKILDVNSVVMNIEKMLRRVIGEQIELKIILSAHLWPVEVDPTQLEQVIINLAVKARDAMPEGGTLIIETANVMLDESYAAAHLDTQPGAHVLLVVSDTGVGMSKEVQAHIFEPFFTTKEVNEGTGLGLSTVFGIVKQSHGNIWVYSEEGQGATFKIYLPRAEQHKTESSKQSLPMSELPRGTETILLVEDETLVRDLALRVLKEQGYTMLEAANGQEGLHQAQLYANPIHLLLTDMIMPGLGGKALADQIKAFYPDIKVLFTSGYTNHTIDNRGILSPNTPFIQKPFSPVSLACKVREVLDGKQ